jgi:hypothetical protein
MRGPAKDVADAGVIAAFETGLKESISGELDRDRVEAFEFIDVGCGSIGEGGGAELAGIKVGNDESVRGIAWSEENEVMRAATDERIDAEADVSRGKVAFEGC